MDDKEKNQFSLKERLDKKFRITILNDETFEEVSSNSFTKLNLYLIISGILIGISLLITALIFFTPLRKLTPGYGDIRQHKEVFSLYKQIDDLEKELTAQKTYTTAFRKMITGDVSTEDSIKDEKIVFQENQINVERSKEDEQLRKEIEARSASSQQQNQNQNSKSIEIEEINFFPPLKGQISANFNLEKKHFGVDIVAPKNTPIKAVMDGMVIGSDWTLENGKTIIVQHKGNIISVYKHNSALLKEIGDKVQSGEAIAIIGNTGILTSGPHLHFELWNNGRAVDTKEYIEF